MVETTRHAGLETCEPKLGLPTAGWQACATTLESRRVSRRIVARLQRLMATVAANPGRCPGLSCGGLSGLVFAPPCWKKEAMDLPLTERLRGCDTADEISGLKHYRAFGNQGGTGQWPVPSGDPPDGTGEALFLPAEIVSPQSAPLRSAGLVARQDGPVARATPVRSMRLPFGASAK